MDDALLGADRAIAEDDGVEIGSDAKAHALTVTAAFVRSQLIHCRLDSSVHWIPIRLRLGRALSLQFIPILL
jgi:hypothetical protein